MDTILTVRNRIRDVLREYDEIVTPVLKFIWALVVFISLRGSFGYFDFFNKWLVIILLSVIFAIVDQRFMFFAIGIITTFHVYNVSLELAIIYGVFFFAMYCVYIRFFPEMSYAIMLAMIACQLNIPAAIPVLVALTAGVLGMVPAAFGIVLYYVSVAIRDLKGQIDSLADISEVDTLKYFLDNVVKNKEMLGLIIVTAATIAIVYIVSRIPFKFSKLVSVGTGAVVYVVAQLLVDSAFSLSGDMAMTLVGALIGIATGVIILCYRGIFDYSHTENVQFEDDDYYYYVKAVPKLDPEKKRLKGRRISDFREVFVDEEERNYRRKGGWPDIEGLVNPEMYEEDRYDEENPEDRPDFDPEEERRIRRERRRERERNLDRDLRRSRERDGDRERRRERVREADDGFRDVPEVPSEADDGFVNDIPERSGRRERVPEERRREREPEDRRRERGPENRGREGREAGRGREAGDRVRGEFIEDRGRNREDRRGRGRGEEA